MTGWNLQSDPTTQESLALAQFGSLFPGQTVMVESGPAASGAFMWSQNFLFRDGDPTDFARLANDDGFELIKVNCSAAQPTAEQTAAPVADDCARANADRVGGSSRSARWGSAGRGGERPPPVVMMLFGSGLLSAGLATFALPLLGRRPRLGCARPRRTCSHNGSPGNGDAGAGILRDRKPLASRVSTDCRAGQAGCKREQGCQQIESGPRRAADVHSDWCGYPSSCGITCLFAPGSRKQAGIGADALRIFAAAHRHFPPCLLAKKHPAPALMIGQP